MTRTLLLLAVVLTANHALAGNHVCRAEVEQLCPNLSKGKALHSCVQQNFSRLSPTCQGRIEQRRAKARLSPPPPPPAP